MEVQRAAECRGGGINNFQQLGKEACGGLIATQPRKGRVTYFFYKGSSQDSFVNAQVLGECGR